jgi:CxxC-x17-CxxC domain-containing protein
MAFQDQTLTCRDCGKDFTWTASEQEFYQSKGFQNAPVRCPADRAAKKARMDGGRTRQLFEITCGNCGKKDSVPFQPRGDKPILCGDCFRKQKNGEIDIEETSKGPKEEVKAEEAVEVEENPEEKVEEESSQETPEEKPEA